MRLACGCVSVFGCKKVLCTSCCSLRCAMLETWDSKDAVTGPLFAFQRTHFRVIAFRVSLWGIRDWLIQIWLHTFSPFFLQSLDMYLIDFPKSIFAFGEGYIQAGGIEFSLSLSLSFSLSLEDNQFSSAVVAAPDFDLIGVRPSNADEHPQQLRVTIYLKTDREPQRKTYLSVLIHRNWLEKTASTANNAVLMTVFLIHKLFCLCVTFIGSWGCSLLVCVFKRLSFWTLPVWNLCWPTSVPFPDVC